MPPAERSLEEMLRGPLLRPHQRVERQREIDETDRGLANETASARKNLINPGRIRQQNERRKQLLAAQSPRPLTPSERDVIAKEEQRLRTDIREGMISRMEQRRAPANEPGLQERIRRWHEAKKPNILRWKHCRILLDQDSTDKDLCNFERYRPEGPLDVATVDAVVPGYLGFSGLGPQYEATFGAADWRQRETQEAFIERMKGFGITVTFGKAAGIRPQADVVMAQSTDDAVVLTVLPPGGPAKRGRGRPRKPLPPAA